MRRYDLARENDYSGNRFQAKRCINYYIMITPKTLYNYIQLNCVTIITVTLRNNEYYIVTYTDKCAYNLVTVEGLVVENLVALINILVP